MLPKGYQQPVRFALATCWLKGTSIQWKVHGWGLEDAILLLWYELGMRPWTSTSPFLYLGFPTYYAVAATLPISEALLGAESRCGVLRKAARYCCNYCPHSSAHSLLFDFPFFFWVAHPTPPPQRRSLRTFRACSSCRGCAL